MILQLAWEVQYVTRAQVLSNVSLFYLHILFLFLALCLMVVKRLCIQKHPKRKRGERGRNFLLISAFLPGRKIFKRTLENSLSCLIRQNWVTCPFLNQSDTVGQNFHDSLRQMVVHPLNLPIMSEQN